MDEPRSEDSFVDDLLSALEQNSDKNICAITYISSGPDAYSSGEKEVKEDESTSENLIPLNDHAVVVLGENVNISDLFKNYIEFIYDNEQTGDARNDNDEDYMMAFGENSLLDTVVENNETFNQIEGEKNSTPTVIQGEEDVEDDRMDDAIENDEEENILKYFEPNGQIERDDSSVSADIQGEEDIVEGEKTEEAVEHNEEVHILINFEPNDNNKDSKEKKKEK
ncbi:hypothetical protein J6590_046344 [Homalodisca vitripennis]|nr:hypothetical protein J6590_046344 [Homalodisca vitripennis]